MTIHETYTMSHAAEVERVKQSAFQAWQKISAADFRVLLAYGHGDKGDLVLARSDIAAALAAIDAALAGDAP